MSNEAEKHFAAIRSAVTRKEVNWLPVEGPEGATAYHGFTPGYMIFVVKGDTQPDGAVTTSGVFSVIRLTPEIARVCFEAAHGSKPKPVCRHCGEHVSTWNSCCDACIELGRSSDKPTDGNPS